MGIAYRSAAAGLSVEVWHGEITAEMTRRHLDALAADTGWGAGERLLTDLTGIAAASLPAADRVLDLADAFVQRLAAQVREAKWAIVAGDSFDQAQRFGAYVEEAVPRLIVFNDLGTACTWLGVDPIAVSAVIDELRQEIRSAGG